MSNKNLLLKVMFTAKDGLSGPLKNIVGLGKSGSEKMAGLKKEARDVGKALRDQRADIARAVAEGRHLGSLVQRERELKEQVEQVNRQIERQTRLNRARAQGAAIREAGQDLRSSGTGNIMAGAAMAAPGVIAAKQAITMESAMADVRKVVDFDTPEQFQKMSDDLVTLSLKIPTAAEGLAQIVAAAGRAGVARKELLIFAEDAAKMGVAFDTTADQAGAMMAKWRTAFGLGQDQVRTLSDKINALANATGGDVGDIAGMVTRIGALGDVSGVAADQIAAIGQVMSSVGVGEEVAATGIKNFMLAMTKAESATKTQRKAFQSLGLDAVQLSKDMQKNSGAAITDILRRIARVPDYQRSGILTQLFGSESVSAIAPMLTKLDQLEANFQFIGDKTKYAGSMTAEYLAAINKTEGALGLAKNAASAINITLGNMLLPTITVAARNFVDVATSVRNWIQLNPGLAKGLAMAGAALSGLVIGVGALKIGLGLLLGPLGTTMGLAVKYGPLVWKAFGLMRAGMMLLGGPALAIAAVIGVVAWQIWKHWDGIKSFFVSNWTFIRNLMLGAMVIFTPWLAAIVYVAKKIYDNWDAISGGISAAIGRIWSFVQPAVAPILAIADTIAGLGQRFLQIGWDLMSGLLKGLWDGAKSVISGVANIAANIGATFAKVLDINSPSRVFMAMGGYITDGLSRGIDRGASGAVSAARSMAAGVAGASLATASMGIASTGGPGGGSAGITIGQMSITVHAAPGQSPQEIAEAVAAEFKKQAGQADAAKRSRYEDD